MTPTFLKYSCDNLNQYAGRIAVCLDLLADDEIWTRGTDNENAIGNLILHLCGNLRQWIGFGVARQADMRDRDAEFAARDGAHRDALKEKLAEAVREATSIISALDAERLSEPTRVQGYELTVLEAIYHVVEHFSYHAGQIAFATKLLTGSDLGFYRHLSRPAHEEKVP